VTNRDGARFCTVSLAARYLQVIICPPLVGRH